MKTKDIVAKLDKGLRHKSGVKQADFVTHYCKIFSNHAYATSDGSWNEFEKTITHVLGMMLYYKRFCEIMGFKGVDGDGFDPRDFVQSFENAEENSDKTQSEQLTKLMNQILDNA